MSTQSTDTSPLILRRKLEALLAELRAYGEAAKRDFAVPYSNLGADDVPADCRFLGQLTPFLSPPLHPYPRRARSRPLARQVPDGRGAGARG